MKPSPGPLPLRGRCSGISLSAADEGIPPGEDADRSVSQLTLETGSRYLGLGANIALGHQWRTGGILEHLAHRAAELRSSNVAPEREERRALIINRLAWPDAPPEFIGDRTAWLRDMVEVRQGPSPGIPTDRLTTQSKLGQFARIRARTAKRRELMMASDGRVCLGGIGGKPLHRLPGVHEESLLTWDAGEPLYLAGPSAKSPKRFATSSSAALQLVFCD